MKAELDRHEGALIVKVKGKVDIGSGDVALRTVLQDVKEMDYERVILDLSGVTHMDSSGVGELISNYTDLRDSGMVLVLSNLNAKIYNLLIITRLVTVFDIYDSNEDAMMRLLTAA